LLSGENWIPTFVAPAEAGVQSSARMARRRKPAVALASAWRLAHFPLPYAADAREPNLQHGRHRYPMSDPNAQIPAGAPLESPHALQLQRGFPRLKFEASLEQEFKRAHRIETLPQIRRNLWLGIVFLILFAVLTHLVLAESTSRHLDLIRIGTFVPLLVVALVVVHSRWYDRFYALVSSVGAALFGVGPVAIAVIAAKDGVSLLSAVMLVTIYIYFMLGMTFYPAVTAALIVFAAYAVAAQIADLPTAPMVIDLSVLAFTNVIGALVCYSLERANR